MPNNEASLEGGPKKIIYAKGKSILRGRNLSQNYLFALGILYNYNLYNPIVFYFQSYIILHIQTKTQLSVCHMSLNLWKHDATDDSVSLLGVGTSSVSNQIEVYSSELVPLKNRNNCDMDGQRHTHTHIGNVKKYEQE